MLRKCYDLGELDQDLITSLIITGWRLLGLSNCKSIIIAVQLAACSFSDSLFIPYKPDFIFFRLNVHNYDDLPCIFIYVQSVIVI